MTLVPIMPLVGVSRKEEIAFSVSELQLSYPIYPLEEDQTSPGVPRGYVSPGKNV